MISRVLLAISAVFLTIYYSNGLKLKGAAEDQFNTFLETSMEDYGKWLKDNNLDPQPPTNAVVSLSRDVGKVYLTCVVSKQFLSGHSDLQSHNIITESRFSGEYYAELGREVTQSYDFNGDFNCSGEVQHIEYGELDENIPFNGRGNFVITARSSEEAIAIMNLGITEAYKFNLEYSWPDYILTSSIGTVQLIGQWNDTRIPGNYLKDVESTFRNLYRTFLLYDNRDLANPSSQLIHRYLREVLENVTITDVIDAVNLPPVFIPTTRGTTTTTTTTSKTSTTTTSSTTTTPTTPTTTSPKSEDTTKHTPNISSRSTIKYWFVLISIVFTLCF